MVDKWTGQLPDGSRVSFVTDYLKSADTTQIIAVLEGTELEIVRMRKGRLKREQVEAVFTAEDFH